MTYGNNISIGSIYKNYFVCAASNSNYDCPIYKKFHTCTIDNNRQIIKKPSDGKFGESDPFVLNETSLSKYTNCKLQTRTEDAEVQRLNVRLKGKVTAERNYYNYM